MGTHDHWIYLDFIGAKDDRGWPDHRRRQQIEDRAREYLKATGVLPLSQQRAYAIAEAIAEWADFIASDYCTDGESIEDGCHTIAFADWNEHDGRSYWGPTDANFSDRTRFAAGLKVGMKLSDVGIEANWSDQYSICDECGEAIRTEPDSYSWLPSYLFVGECGFVCLECIEADFEAYKEEFINRETNGARFFSPGDHGFIEVRPYDDGREQYGSFECGFHPGQADNPGGQLNVLNEAGFDVVFDLSKGQFDTKWAIWVRPVDDQGELEFSSVEYSASVVQEVREQVREILEHCDACRFVPSPATQMEAALREASL